MASAAGAGSAGRCPPGLSPAVPHARRVLCEQSDPSVTMGSPGAERSVMRPGGPGQPRSWVPREGQTGARSRAGSVVWSPCRAGAGRAVLQLVVPVWPQPAPCREGEPGHACGRR